MNGKKLFVPLAFALPKVSNLRHGIKQSLILSAFADAPCNVTVLKIHKKSFVKAGKLPERCGAEKHEAARCVGNFADLVVRVVKHTVFNHGF